MRLVDIAALSLTHHDEVVNQQLAIVSADSTGLLQALVGHERQVLTLDLQVSCLVLEHVREGCFLAGCETLVLLLDEADATFALVSPLAEISTSVEPLFLLENVLFLFHKVPLDLISVLQNFTERLVLEQMVLHVASKEALEKLSLLGDEVAGAGDHLAQPGVHLVLVLALSHTGQLTQLLDELVHSVHGARQSLALLVNFVGTLDDLSVEDLI